MAAEPTIEYIVDPVTGCWLFQGFINSKGYGIIRLVVNGKKTLVRAHRYMYKKLVGPIPDGKILRHSCDVRRCINPEHLEPGTHWQNQQDCRMRGRTRPSQLGRPLSQKQRDAVAEQNRRRHMVGGTGWRG